MEIKLTVFTPTYNRAYSLHKCYESMLRQRCKDFIWLIIDDGSTDNTGDLVREWQTRDNGFEIRYIYKENGGMYTGYNTAISNATTELMMCIDSDDWLTDNAIGLVLDCWEEHGSDQYTGILGLDCLDDGTIIGDPLPDRKSINRIDLFRGKYKIRNGDRKEVFRTELYRALGPMEVIPGEKDYNPLAFFLEAAKTHDTLVLNERLCVVDYQPDGMSATILKQYLRSAKSFKKMRIEDMSLPGLTLSRKLKESIYYTSSCILSGERCLPDTPYKLAAILMWPFGLLLAIIVLIYNKVR